MAAGDLNIKLGIDTKDAVSDLNNFFSTYSQNAGKAARDLDAALGGKVEKEIVISIKDDKPLAKLEISAEQVSRKLGTLGQALEGSFAGTTKVLKRQISLLEDLQENTRKFSRKTGEVTPEWRKLESAIAAAKNKLATFDSKAIAKVKEEASQAAARLGKLGQALEGGLANTPRILNEQLSLLQNLQQDTAKFSRSTGEVTAEWKKVADAIAAAKAKLASFSDKPLPKPEPPKKDTGGPDRGKLQQAMSGSFANTTKVLKEQIALLEKLKESTAKFNRKTGEVTEEWKKLNKIIGQAKDKLAKFGPGPLEQLKNSLQGVIGKFIAVQTLSNLATGALQALGAAIVNVFQSGMKMELLSLQLETFTGGAQQAEAAMAKFIDIAVKTPFNIEQVAEAAKILMAYGIEANSAVEATERLAIAGSTSGAQLDNLSRNLGQIQAQGRAYTRDLTQFAIQGIPIWDALSQVTGKTTVELKKMAEEGTVSFDMVNGALAAATKEGTALWMISQKMQETMTGRFEAIASAIQVTAGAFLKMIQDFDNATGIVSGLFNITKGAIQGLGAAFKIIGDNMKTIIPILGGIITGMVTLFTISKWATYAAGIATVVKVLWTVVVAQKAIAAWQLIVNALAGPAGWANIAAALALGVAAYAGLNAMVGKHVEEREKENQKLEEAAEKYKTVQERQKALIDQYGLIEGKTRSFAEQLKALEEEYKDGKNPQEYAKKLAILRDEMAALMPAAESAKQKIAEIDKALNKLKDQKTNADKYFKDRLDGIEKNKKAEDDRHNQEKKNIDEEKKAINEKAAVAKEDIDTRKEYEDAYHDAVIKNIDAQAQKLEASHERSKAISEEKKALIEQESQARIDSLQSSMATADAFHEKAMSQIRAQGEAAISQLEREKEKRVGMYDAQIQALEALGPAEQRLAAMRQQELQAKARDRSLTEKERLEAQAQLERMAKQQQIAELKKKQKEEELAFEARINAEKQKQTEAETQLTQAHKLRTVLIQQSIAAEQKRAQEKIKEMEEEIKKKDEAAKKDRERMEGLKKNESERHANAKKQLEDQGKVIEKNKDTQLKALEERAEAEDEYHEKVKEQYEAQKERIEAAKKKYQELYDERKKQLEDMKTKIKEEGKAVEETKDSVQKLRDMYQEVINKIKEAIIQQNKLNAAIANKGGSKGEGDKGQGAGAGGGLKLTSDANTTPKSPNQRGSAFRAAGGPVAGGSVYTVNELGKEAFLSAAGHLSMINAPSWGQWRAPGAGTVIPAHLTSQLSIPSGGVNVNSRASANAAGAGAGGGIVSLVKALAGALQGGDNIQNNVTIQSANTTQTASDMLVALTKVRRRRYS